MTASRFLSAFALAAVAMAGGFAADASAQSRSPRDSCDQICFNRPNAKCYQACFAADGGHSSSVGRKAPRERPVNALGSDWRSIVLNSNGPGRGGNGGGGNSGGGNGGAGGGGKGK
jgi:hypothetical protein